MGSMNCVRVRGKLGLVDKERGTCVDHSVSAPEGIESSRLEGPSTARMRVMMGLLWFAVLATLAYWVIWFGVARRWLASADTPSYYAFENAFPAADAWMAVTGALGAIALQRRKA